MSLKFIESLVESFGKSKTEIAIRNDPRVDDVSDERQDDAGIWVDLKQGYCWFEGGRKAHNEYVCTHSVRRDTWPEVKKELKRNVVKCDCYSCTGVKNEDEKKYENNK